MGFEVLGSFMFSFLVVSSLIFACRLPYHRKEDYVENTDQYVRVYCPASIYYL